MSDSRRVFLKRVGSGMLLASLGSHCVSDLGLSVCNAADEPRKLDFGALEQLVQLMQETDPDALTKILADKLRRGTDLKTLVTAGALANARTFGGQDYIGFHTFMALSPAYNMAMHLPTEQQALPVLKVLHRNSTRIQALGSRNHEVLLAAEPEAIPVDTDPGVFLRSIARTGDVNRADRVGIGLAQLPCHEAFQHVMMEVEDEVDVHRVVLAWRAIDTLSIAGTEWANCLLRQSIRYCANVENQMLQSQRAPSPIRKLLPELIERYALHELPGPTKQGDDRWIDELAQTIFRGTREQAADAVAQALHGGYSPQAIAEALSIAANRLVLFDRGRPEKWANSEKPAGSCHGDSIGVHASDAANAWRNIVKAHTSPSDRGRQSREPIAALIVGAFHTGGQSENCADKSYPLEEHMAELKADSPEVLLKQAEEAIRSNEQFRAAAAIQLYGQRNLPEQPVFNLMRRFATSEDGALHAEKYFNTVTEEFLATRQSFRWNQLVALARVTASEFGRSSAGYLAAKEALGVSV